MNSLFLRSNCEVSRYTLHWHDCTHVHTFLCPFYMWPSIQPKRVRHPHGFFWKGLLLFPALAFLYEFSVFLPKQVSYLQITTPFCLLWKSHSRIAFQKFISGRNPRKSRASQFTEFYCLLSKLKYFPNEKQ